MANQADFPNIYVDASATGTKDGSQQYPYAAFSEINWSAGGDNSITDYYNGVYGPVTASAIIHLKRDGEWFEKFNWGVGGTADYRVILTTYGVGEDPIINGTVYLTTATHEWVPSANWTSTYKEYYCRLSTGLNPNLHLSTVFFVDGVNMVRGGTAPDFDGIGSLNDHEWAYGNDPADGLTYETFYWRDESGDPDTSGVAIDVPQRGCIRIYARPYTLVDGIHIVKGDEESWGYRCDGAPVTHHNDIKNCIVEWCSKDGIANKSSYGVVDNCEVSYCGAHNIEAGGAPSAKLTNITFSNNNTHHARITGYSGSSPFSGYGLKFMWVTNSVMFGNWFHHNEFDGIDFDGSSGEGTTDNEIYDNLIHDNGYNGILIEILSHRNKVYRNLIYNNAQMSSRSGVTTEVQITQNSTDCEVFNNIIYTDSGSSGGTAGVRVINYSAGGCTGAKVYNNVIDGGGYFTRGVAFSDYNTPQDGKCFNNIIVGITSAGYAWSAIGTDANSLVGFDADYNLMNRDGGGYIVKYGTGYGTQYTLAGIQGLGFELHGIAHTDPLFTDAENHDYTLQAGSPCISAGADLGEPYNIGIIPGSTWPSNVQTANRDDY